MTHTEKLFLPIYIKEKEYKPQAVPACREASEPLSVER